MFFKKTLLIFTLCFSLIFSHFSSAGIFKSVAKGLVVRECIHVILKNYGKKAAQKIILSSKDRLINYIKANPKLRQSVFNEIDDVAAKMINKESVLAEKELIKKYAQSFKNEINQISPEIIPKGIKLPKNGIWSGEKGNSRFFPSKVNKNSQKNIKELYDVNGNTGIKYDKGNPNFNNVVEHEFNIKGLNGKNKDDFPLVYDKLIKDNVSIRGQTFKNRAEVERFLSRERLTIHHKKGGDGVQIVDRDMHEVYRHNGGASDLRNK